LNKKKK